MGFIAGGCLVLIVLPVACISYGGAVPCPVCLGSNLMAMYSNNNVGIDSFMDRAASATYLFSGIPEVCSYGKFETLDFQVFCLPHNLVFNQCVDH